MNFEPEAMVGQTLDAVSSSWHEYEGHRSAEPVHLWLHLDGLGAVRLTALNGLVFSQDPVHESYDIGECGRIFVERSGPWPLTVHVGERVTAAFRLLQAPLGMTVGLALTFQRGSVGIADLGDELVVAPWPSADWTRWNVSTQARADERLR